MLAVTDLGDENEVGMDSEERKASNGGSRYAYILR